jgi:excisionase family DNA binding protein
MPTPKRQPTQPQVADLLTVEEVARLFRTSMSTVRYWRHAGRGPQGTRVGRRVLYDARDVLAYIDAERERQQAEAESASG